MFVTRSQTMVLGRAADSAANVAPQPCRIRTGPRTGYTYDVIRPEQAAIYRLSPATAIRCTSTRRQPASSVSTTCSCTGCARWDSPRGRSDQRDRPRGSAGVDIIELSIRQAGAARCQLRTEMWRTGDAVRFRTLQGDVVALSSGTATLAGWLTMDQRRARGQRNREALIQAAIELFTANGYEPTTVEQISGRRRA